MVYSFAIDINCCLLVFTCLGISNDLSAGDIRQISHVAKMFFVLFAFAPQLEHATLTLNLFVFTFRLQEQ
jgi:hypothetical protein